MEMEHIHWFLREACDAKPRCAYCFGPAGGRGYSEEGDIEMAKALIVGGVKKVTLGGGEPTLARNLVPVVRTLKDGGVYVSLHTNGLRLDDNLLDGLAGLVGDIALPMDAIDPEIQRRLRSERFVEKVSGRLPELSQAIISRGIGVGIHTVFTCENYLQIPAIYRQLKRLPFKYWRIYEYNVDLARMASLGLGGRSQARIDRYQETMDLGDDGDHAKANSDGLLANLLLMEERMTKYGDARIQFVVRQDGEDYSFLRPSGDVDYYKHHSINKRRNLGNILVEGLPELRRKWEGRHDSGSELEDDSEEFFEFEGCLPLWLRMDLGNYWEEEIDEVDGRSWPKIWRITDLWKAREKRIEDQENQGS
jgi:sulfatase maturation enzyme AslB (radical SAM superfamily)